jgi:hypothetical protein
LTYKENLLMSDVVGVGHPCNIGAVEAKSRPMAAGNGSVRRRQANARQLFPGPYLGLGLPKQLRRREIVSVKNCVSDMICAVERQP